MSQSLYQIKQPYKRTSMTSYSTFAEGVEKTPVSVDVLLDICRRPRFAGSPGEKYVIGKYISTLPGVRPDAFENYWVLIPDGEKNPTTLFSAHTDTVHHKKAENVPYKLRMKDGWLSVKDGGVLGADDGTGIWVLLNLIQAKVPGLYIFHREEEIGGNGSTFIAKQHAELITDLGIKHCIAFDRKGTQDIITHQSCGRCCSDEFAEAFAKALNADSPLAFRADDTGSFTDSANYIDLIGECTNLSVGYYDQHSQEECQDLTFVSRLVNQLIKLDFSQLPQARQPGEEDPDDFSLRDWYRDYHDYGNYDGKSTTKAKIDADTEVFPKNATYMDLVGLINDYPGEVADLLMDMVGLSPFEVAEQLVDVYGCEITLEGDQSEAS